MSATASEISTTKGRHVRKSTKRGSLQLDVFEPSNPKKPVVVGKKPMLWHHPNGYWYILFGPRLRRRVSTQTKDADRAAASLVSFIRLSVTGRCE
jgi:hypothetical protein